MLLVMLVVLPALAILLASGMEQRRSSIETAKQDILLLTHTMAEAQKDVASSSRQILSTLSLMPQVRTMQRTEASEIFRAVLERNPLFLNISLADLSGNVVASGKPFTAADLSDRKHFQDALQKKEFAVGEYIITRVGTMAPAFAFAYPVLDADQRPLAVLTIAITLAHIDRYYDASNLPPETFIAVTDHQGIRLYFHPPQERTNPIGKKIRQESWEAASGSTEPGIFMGEGSDGIRRIFAFEQVRLTPGTPPYMYVWAGISEARIIGPANAALRRNVFLLFLSTSASLALAWIIGRDTLIRPLRSLVTMTRKFAAGDLESRSTYTDEPGEIGSLTTAFHEMARALTASQDTLRANETRFRLLLDSLDAFVYVADMDRHEVLFINAYGKRLVGDIVGKLCWQSIQAGQTGPCPFCTNKHLVDAQGRPGPVYTWEFQNTVTGSWYYIHDRAIQWTDGRIVRLEIATDITERKMAETRLAEERERLAVTLRSIGDGVITTDTQGRVVLMNKVAEILTGWTSDESVGTPLLDVLNIVDAETRTPHTSPVERVLASGRIVGLDDSSLLISKQGPERRIADSAAPIRDKDSRIIGVVLVFRDITSQLRTERELIKAKKLEAIGILAGGIAHDFNNILAAILGNIELSLLDRDLKEKTRSLLQEASKATYRARELTHQLLTFARGGEPIKETASLAEVVRESVNFILHGEASACRFSIPNDLWLVDIDKGQISQVVQNIILNARDAMLAGGMLDVSCENVGPVGLQEPSLPSTGRFVKLSITDTGTGIPPEIIDRIFDPYFSTKEQGSGLGLAITHSIVSKHGGYITVRSAPGAGTTFNVFLPASERTSLPVKEHVSVHTSTRKAKVLVMDDDQQVRDISQAMLNELGHEVVLAQDGRQAIRLYQEAHERGTPFHLVIMDLTIPGKMGGKEAVQQILAYDPAAKVIVSSGYSNDPVMANFRDYGFCAALVKPFQFDELGRMIGQIVA